VNEQISKFLLERIAANDFPSAVYLVAEKGGIIYQDALGYAVVEPERKAATLDTIYDLASLTKPLVTGLIAARMIEDKEIYAGDRAGAFLPEFDRSGKRETTISELATHTSGYAPWIPLYLRTSNPLNVIETIVDEPLFSTPGNSVNYSDLNFITLARIIESRKDLRVDIAVEEIFDLLGMSRTSFCPLAPGRGTHGFSRAEIAASEKGNEYERQTCIEKGYLTTAASGVGLFREHQIWGEVHDGNAWFMGGIAGHAGLFSTAEEVFKIALQFMPNYTRFLKPETCRLFRTNFTKGMNEDRSFAFQLASTDGSTAGMKMSPESFGHNGFTGTSMWIDPVKERIFVLLTNRTHNRRLPFVNINSVRRHFHDLAINALDSI